jgi:hypothetical protein
MCVTSASAWLCVAGLVIFSAGCADSGVARVPGSGRVTFDGEMVHSASISFLPEHGPSANGEITGGRYNFSSANGPVAGSQRVLIQTLPGDKFAPESTGRWEFEYVVPETGPFSKNFELNDAANP